MAEEILKKVHLFGQDYIVKGAGGAAGGVGGNGMAITGGGYVGPDGGITTTNRWLRFDFNDPSHRSLIILGGTSFTIGENIVTIEETTSYNLADYLGEEGADYYVFINAEGRVVCSTLRTQPDGYMFIGQFHTLCNGVPANTTAILPDYMSAPVGDELHLLNYNKNQDLDFYNFYLKKILTTTNYRFGSVVSMDHPLSGFNTGDILPESVWCLNFHPSSLSWDGMVYCNYGDFAVDIYLQSGSGTATRSEYGAVHTINQFACNHHYDAILVGKLPLKFDEFVMMSWGSNQDTSITGARDWSTVGGHVDSANRRMISFIGCEECCGYLEQAVEVPTFLSSAGSTIGADGSDRFGMGSDTFAAYNQGGAYDWESDSGSIAIDGTGNGWNDNNDIGKRGGRGRANIEIV